MNKKEVFKIINSHKEIKKVIHFNSICKKNNLTKVNKVFYSR